MKPRIMVFAILMLAAWVGDAMANPGGMMTMPDRMRKLDQIMQQARDTSDHNMHMKLMHEHMQAMRDAMDQMNQMMGGRQEMMQSMGGGMMMGAQGQGGNMGGGMMGSGGNGSGKAMSPEMMQQRMDMMQQRMTMMQMMMDQMMEHQQELERLPKG